MKVRRSYALATALIAASWAVGPQAYAQFGNTGFPSGNSSIPSGFGTASGSSNFPPIDPTMGYSAQVKALAKQAACRMNLPCQTDANVANILPIAEVAYAAVRDRYANTANEPGNMDAVTAVVNAVRGTGKRPLTAADRALGLEVPGNNWSSAAGQWNEVVVDKSTGAECMDGSNYKIYTKLNPATTNLLIFMEPGGACFDHGTCTGQVAQFNQDGTPKIGPVSFTEQGYTVTYTNRVVKNEKPLARNKDGIPPNYLNILDSHQTAVLNSPLLQKSFLSDLGATLDSYLTSRRKGQVMDLLESKRFKMEDWNIAFFPYCSADMHAGNATNVYNPPADYVTGAPLVVRHKGMKNLQAGLSLLRDKLPQPAQVLFAGQSAGGAAVDLWRPYVSEVLQPTHGFYAFADGVPIGKEAGKHYWQATEEERKSSPQTILLSQVRMKHWGQQPTSVVRTADGQALPLGYLANVPDTSPLALLERVVNPKLAAKGLPPIDRTNLSDLGKKASQAYPDDRMLYIMSQSDQTIPSYIYSHNPGRKEAAIRDGNINSTFPKAHQSWLAEYHRSMWGVELAALKSRILQQNGNVGYFMPSGRMMVKSHVLTGFNYEGSINYDNGTTVVNAIDSLMDRSRNVVRDMEGNNRKGLFVCEIPQAFGSDTCPQQKTTRIHNVLVTINDTSKSLLTKFKEAANTIFTDFVVWPIRPRELNTDDWGLYELPFGQGGGGPDSQFPVAAQAGGGLTAVTAGGATVDSTRSTSSASVVSNSTRTLLGR